MSCLSLTLLKIYTVVTAVFTVHQSMYLTPEQEIAGVMTRFTGTGHTGVNLTVVNDTPYSHCFSHNTYYPTTIYRYHNDFIIFPENVTVNPTARPCKNWFDCLFH